VDRLRAMEVFRRVVEFGSFTRAAASLRMPRASVTAAVQELEAEVGVRLLHRTTRRVTPTADGARYHAGLARILAELADLEADLGSAVADARGRVRVDVSAASGRHVIAPALPGLLAAHPELVVEIGSTDRPVDLAVEGVDLAIRGGDVHDLALAGRRLGVLPVRTFAAPAYLAARGAPTHPHALGGHRFVGFFSPRTGQVFDVDFVRDGEERAVRPAFQVAANDSDTWLALAVGGLGLLQSPVSRAVRGCVARGELVQVLPEWASEGLPLWALWPRDRHLPARVRVFVAWVAELFEAECAEAEAFVGG
jgi:LysR family transcriptional regulator for bpeEF and oprC